MADDTEKPFVKWMPLVVLCRQHLATFPRGWREKQLYIVDAEKGRGDLTFKMTNGTQEAAVILSQHWLSQEPFVQEMEVTALFNNLRRQMEPPRRTDRL